MTWAYPWMFLLWLLVPVLVLLRYGSRGRPGLRFTDARVLQRLPVSWAARARVVLPVLYGAGLVLLVLAMARPQEGIEETRINRDAVDLVLLLDVSGSMLAEDFYLDGQRVNRLEVCIHAAKEFIEKRRNDRIAVVAFAGVPYVMAPLTFDQNWLLQQVERIEIAMVEDGTAIGAAVASGLNRLRDSEAASKVMVLLTDGVNNAGGLSPENAAQAAAAMGVRIHTIGAGTQSYAPFPERDRLGRTRYFQRLVEFDERQLQAIAEVTGGQYFHANNTEALEQIYAEIDELERTEIEVVDYVRYRERFAPFLMWAIGLLALERLLAIGRLERWP